MFIGVFGIERHPIVATQQGKVEGSLSINEDYYEFLGIRYAVPIKFKAPTEPPSFPGVYKANVRAVVCSQFPCGDLLAAPSDNENCLILNIYTPLNCLTNVSLPVMVFLHGGGFGVGSSSPSFYGPRYLVGHGVIVITVNYRLNAYGFLNLGIPEAPGNAGLKDVRSALRWINRNIGNFGGDPDNVTVMGQGSGGTAAIYLMLSESTKGLFNRIISESGSIFTPQSFDPDPLETASHLAKTLGVNVKKPEELLRIYRDTSIADVEEAISKQMNPKSVFVPTLEKIFDDEEPFLIDTPFNILAAGKDHRSYNAVPAVLGTNTVEGLTCTLDYNTITSQIDRIKNEDYSALDQRSLRVPKDSKEEVRKILRDTYFSNISTEEAVIGGIINMNTDFSFVGPMTLLSEFLGNQSQTVYSYIFDYNGGRNLGSLLTNSSLPATAHLDDLFYVFDIELLSLPIDENDARIIAFMSMVFTNFAKYGNPTPNEEDGVWLPYPYNLAVRLAPQYVGPLTPERAYFWRSLYYKYGADIKKYNELV
ncbi:Juvenile hormone esterase [Eumeta japonica]|uniref:Juvenile hormone esterase n=1 Tax=Eumeta variegata TaxID=151549 RepID=A0A4C1TJH4_EUMVA|nr:Juvenile hormone esterase [Eumeta japonica]